MIMMLWTGEGTDPGNRSMGRGEFPPAVMGGGEVLGFPRGVPGSPTSGDTRSTFANHVAPHWAVTLLGDLAHIFTASSKAATAFLSNTEKKKKGPAPRRRDGDERRGAFSGVSKQR